MKLLRLSLLLLTGLGFFLAACQKDFLDRKPLNSFSDAAVWSDYSLAEQFANNIYSGIISGFERGGYHLSGATDEGENTFPWPITNDMNRGDLSYTNPDKSLRYGYFWNNPPTYWTYGYDYIRRCNIFLDNVRSVPGDTAKIAALTGEVKFLRAFYYHELVKFYGGVPLVTRALGVEDISQLLTPRNTYTECVDFISKELAEAAALLPATRSGQSLGRATRGAALALQGRVLLHAERWADAATASMKVIDARNYTLFPNFENLFKAANNNNQEVIFSKQYKSTLVTHDFNRNNGLISIGGWGGVCPTQNLVDMFEMTDGQTYDKSPLYDPNNPYKNRDPRFYGTVIYDGAVLGTGGDAITVQTRVKGNNGIDGGPNQTDGNATTTGYYLRKYIDEAFFKNPTNGYNNWILLRLGEVLLNYAEAQNEAVGPDASVYDAVNTLRARVKMPALPAGLSKEEMRERIRRERAVELAFEDQRFFDLRRWKLAEEVIGAPIYGMRISQDGKTFTRFKVEDRVFRDRDYLIPIQQDELIKNSKLQQNPGW
ncbi:RagB/SusD family nutrient uptake outer membrane protein [Spirosoma sp. SC4-14]|uniref:RagB/SusD family nutrient uptake outer membrane protein n=1 Tax=Spirosoma sp. SC4-14 TaxID=3128900 RepID=UPI0030CEB8E4